MELWKANEYYLASTEKEKASPSIRSKEIKDFLAVRYSTSNDPRCGVGVMQDHFYQARRTEPKLKHNEGKLVTTDVFV